MPRVKLLSLDLHYIFNQTRYKISPEENPTIFIINLIFNIHTKNAFSFTVKNQSNLLTIFDFFCSFLIRIKSCKSLYLQNEAMTGTVHTQNPTYSRLTLALLEDSGWYLPNYEMVTKLIFTEAR